jgi:hypothetical protein
MFSHIASTSSLDHLRNCLQKEKQDLSIYENLRCCSLRASSSSLSPFTQLFHKDPNLRILGQPHLRPYIDHKLQPRSMPCIFLGYAPQQKGYRCLHIPTNRIWISRHVVFDENRFPFRELSTSGLTIPESTIEPALAPLRGRAASETKIEGPRIHASGSSWLKI